MKDYTRIGVPIDLAHADRLEKALYTAGALASQFGLDVVLITVVSPAPDAGARSPKEAQQRLENLAQAFAKEHRVTCAAEVRVTGDPAADLDDVLNKCLAELQVDLVVMASHIPGIRDYLFQSNASQLAAHSDRSVFIVRA